MRVLASPIAGVVGKPTTFVATVQDVTEEVAATEALAFQAMHDSLTGLPNRALFLDRLGVELSHAARTGSDLAVMFLDLDRFKVVNDGLGHHVGDELLKAVSVRLLDVVRAGETVARLGGDEFTFIFHDVDGVTRAAVVAQRILDALQEPITIEGSEVVVTGSIGIVLPGPGAEAATVLRDADAGMYRAKETGRARFEIFDEDQRRAVVARLAIENDLRHGIGRGELRLYYQPLVIDLDRVPARCRGTGALGAPHSRAPVPRRVRVRRRRNGPHRGARRMGVPDRGGGLRSVGPRPARPPVRRSWPSTCPPDSWRAPRCARWFAAHCAAKASIPPDSVSRSPSRSS